MSEQSVYAPLADLLREWVRADLADVDRRALFRDMRRETDTVTDFQMVVDALLEAQELLMEAGQERGRCLGCDRPVDDHRPADTPDCPMTRITAVLAAATPRDRA